MQALHHQGSPDSTRLVPAEGFESASPTRPAVDKSSRLQTRFSLVSDTSLNSTITVGFSTRNSTYLTPTTDSQPRPTTRARKREIATARQSARPPATAGRQADRPER